MKVFNTFSKWWAALDWQAILDVVVQRIVSLVVLIIVFTILTRIAHFFVSRTFKTYEKKTAMHENRLATIRTLTTNIVNYTLGFFFIYALLSILGIPVGSLLAGAGIAGIAIGLGAQGFMNDLITGFFIITEQQIDVGEYIILQNLQIEGTVTSIGMRTVQLQATDGTVHFVPNRNIMTISNTSRANRQVLINVRVEHTEDMQAIRELIAEANQQVFKQYETLIQTPPNIVGLVDLGSNNFAIQTTLYVNNGAQVKLKEEFLAASLEKLTAAGFTIPSGIIQKV